MTIACVSASAQSFSGNWIFTGQSSAFALTFTATGVITQSGSNISGALSITGSPCASAAQFSGLITGTGLNATLDESGQLVTVRGAIAADFNSASGTYSSPSGGCTSGDHGTWAAARADSGPPSITGVTSAATFFPGVAKEGYGAAFGSSLSSATYSAPPPYPSKLGSTEVFVCPGPGIDTRCTQALIVFASPGQVNFIVPQMPSSVAAASSAAQSVYYVARVNGLNGIAFSGVAYSFQPGIFTAGYDCYTADSFPVFFNVGQNCGLSVSRQNPFQAARGTITDLSGNVIYSGNPARIGRFYVLWLTGLGFIGSGATPKPLSLSFAVSNINETSASLSVPAPITYAGESSAFPGLYQVNFQIPVGVINQNGIKRACGSFPAETRIDVTEGSVSSAWIPVAVKAGDVPCF